MEIKCKKCGSLYELKYTRTIMRDKDVINCHICGEELYSWSEAKIWYATLIEQKELHKQNLKS